MGETGVELPQQQEARSGQVSENSQYFETALNEVAKKYPDNLEQVRGILENTDKQGIENFQTFTPLGDKELQVSFTKVSVKDAIATQLPESKTEVDEKRKKLVHIVFGGVSIPGAGNGSIFVPWDIVYDRIINYIPRVMNGDDIEVYSVGYPQDFGGKVSEKWISSALANPQEAYGSLYGEFVKKIMLQGPDKPHVILHGMSIGSTVAELTARALSAEDRKRVQVLMGNPVGDHGVLQSLIKGFQIPLGFLGEAVARMNLDDRIKSSRGKEVPYLNHLKEVLNQKGFDWTDTPEQLKLKYKAALVDVYTVVKGSPLDSEKTRSFIRRGILDPTSFPNIGFLRSLVDIFRQDKTKISASQNNKSLEFAINTSHFINRFRVDKWARILNTLSLHQTSSTPPV